MQSRSHRVTRRYSFWDLSNLAFTMQCDKAYFGRQNSEMVPQIPTPGIHTCYNPFPSSMSRICEYEGIVTLLIRLHDMWKVICSYSCDYVMLHKLLSKHISWWSWRTKLPCCREDHITKTWLESRAQLIAIKTKTKTKHGPEFYICKEINSGTTQWSLES